MNREDYIAKAPTFTIYDGFCKTKSVLENHSRIIVSVSGGSDSDDMVDIAEHLKPDDGCELIYVWFDTGIEMAATKRHLKYLQERYGIEIHTESGHKKVAAAALPMNNHIVNKTRVLIGAKVAPQFEKMIQKEYEQMQRMRYFDPHRSAYIPIQTLPDGRIQLAIRSTENNCRYNRRQAERMMNSPCDLVLYLNAYASPSNQGVRCRLVNFTILDGKEEKNLPRIGSWRSDDI